MVVFTGISGSGKSSLAFDTLYAEAQRRFMESVAPHARRLIEQASAPDVDGIDGLPPAVALQQSRAGAQERSTVGSLTRISVTLRLLFSRAGLHPADIPFLPAEAFSPNNTQGACPACQGMGMVHEVKADALVPDGSLSIREGAIASWPNGWQAKNLRSILDSLGYDIDAPWDTLAEKDREWILFTDEQPSVPIFMGLNAEQRREAIAAGTEPAYTGTYTSARKYLLQSYSGGKDSVKKRLSRFITVGPCNECHGKRLNRNALAYTFAGHDIAEMGELTITQLKALLLPFAEGHSSHMPGEAALREAVIRMTTDICGRLDQLERLGLGHLSLGRRTTMLSSGQGQITIELMFMPEASAPCSACGGRRYNEETLQVRWHNRTIADVLDLTVDEAVEVFRNNDSIQRSLAALAALGLGYLKLGQPATELSGGECQRIKLAWELQRVQRGKTLYLLDEPSTGLHPADMDKLMRVLDRLVQRGDTVVMAEHDMRIAAEADWVLDLGPGSGENGGRIVATGTPEEVSRSKHSLTAPWLAARLKKRNGDPDE
ncbi:hypothetical protein [Klebsiella pneumoniae]